MSETECVLDGQATPEESPYLHHWSEFLKPRTISMIPSTNHPKNSTHLPVASATVPECGGHTFPEQQHTGKGRLTV